MLQYSDFAGMIFDVDDTLLNNVPPGEKMGLHAQSRLMAVHEIGKRRQLVGLENFTYEQCVQSFKQSKVHRIHDVVWQMLIIAGVVRPEREIDETDPLLNEIVELKEHLHEDLLRAKGRAIDGAYDFVSALANNGFAGKLAIASTATRRDIDIFFEVSGLGEFFPDEKIISRQSLTHAKPHPEAYDLAFAVLGLPEKARAKVAAFEDDPRGIMSAKAAGLFVCAITTIHKRSDLAGLTIPPDLIADSYAEFAKLFGLPVTLEI